MKRGVSAAIYAPAAVTAAQRATQKRKAERRKRKFKRSHRALLPLSALPLPLFFSISSRTSAKFAVSLGRRGLYTPAPKTTPSTSPSVLAANPPTPAEADVPRRRLAPSGDGI